MPGNKKHKIQEIHVLTKLACLVLLVLRSFATPQSEIVAYVYLLVFQGSTNEVTPIECVFREQTQTRTCTRYPHQHSRRTGLSPKSPTGFSLNKDAAAGMFLLPCNQSICRTEVASNDPCTVQIRPNSSKFHLAISRFTMIMIMDMNQHQHKMRLLGLGHDRSKKWTDYDYMRLYV